MSWPVAMHLRAWARGSSKGCSPSPVLLSLPPSHLCTAHRLLTICNSSPYVQVHCGVKRQGEHHPAEKPPWDVLKDAGRQPAHRYFIVVSPSRCRTGQLFWMCWFPASAPAHQVLAGSPMEGACRL